VANGLPWIAAAVSFAAMLLLTPAVRARAARWGLVDRPNPRSSHRGVVPRAAGLALLAAIGSALAVLPASWWRRGPTAVFLLGALALAAVGLCDDRWGVRPAIRLGAQLAVAAAFLACAGSLEHLPLPPPLDLALGGLGPLASVLWIMGVVNFYNFMDGIDGLAGLQAVVTGGGIAVAAFDPVSSCLGAAVAGAGAGFLVFNWAPASIFLGDAGSSVLGYTLAVLPFLAAREMRGPAVGLVTLSLWFFLADATWTLLRRAVRGARLLEGHREHLYQRLVITGLSHARVAGSLGVAAVGLTCLSIVALRTGGAATSWAVLGLATLLFAGEVALVRQRELRVARGGGEARW
jgi:UDP-N-acetylmuramyl pentapeptide phosphotransferase/UDP-N-acetylglucosamine-1-phosphate transferase